MKPRTARGPATLAQEGHGRNPVLPWRHNASVGRALRRQKTRIRNASVPVRGARFIPRDTSEYSSFLTVSKPRRRRHLDAREE